MRTQPKKKTDVKINRSIPCFDLHHITPRREQKSEHKTINRNETE